MLSEYSRARENLVLIGLSAEDATDVTSCAKNLVRDILLCSGSERSLANVLSSEYGLEKRMFAHGLDGYLSKPKTSPLTALSLDEDISYALTGKPGVGKTTLLKRLNMPVFDEFWPVDPSYIFQKKVLERTTVPYVLAACQVIESVDIRLHLWNENRFSNIGKRMRDGTDALRSSYSSAFELHDTVVYETERIRADICLDANEIKY